MRGWKSEWIRGSVIRGTIGLVFGTAMILGLSPGISGGGGPDVAAGSRTLPNSAPGGNSVELSEFLCCGQTTGGTKIWGISYPRGWQVMILPNNPREFFGALFMDPQSSIVVAYLPAATTVPGAITDHGNVDQFLNGVVMERQQEFKGFQEIQRQPLAGISGGRLWVGTWPGPGERMWEALIVAVNPTNLDAVFPGMPRGNLTMMGVRAASSQWAMGHDIYERMVASAKIKRLDGGYSPWDSGVTKPDVSPGMVRFCPRHCDWIWVDADRHGWPCPRDGAPTEPYKVGCR